MWTALLTLALLLLAGALYQALATRREAGRFRPHGRWVAVDKRRLHLDCTGEGSPVVVLEAGLGASSISWCLVQPAVGRFTRVCSYDRAGAGWSDASAAPPTAENVVADLRALLAAAACPPPYVLVAHSAGALSVRLFAAKYPAEVSGIVLVDPIAPEDWVNPSETRRRRMRGGLNLCRRGARLAHIGIVRLLLHAVLRTGSSRLSEWGLFLGSGRIVGGGERIASALRQLPPEVPPLLRAFWSRPSFFHSVAAQIGALPESARQVLAAGPLPDVPLVVLSAGRSPFGTVEKYERMAQLSSRGRHIVAEESDHFIILDQPDLIASTVREVVRAAARTSSH